MYVNAFLVCSGGFLAPLAGVNISNYIFIRKTKLDLNALYDPNGEFAFKRLSKYNKPFAMILYVIAAVLVVLGLVCNKEYLSMTSAMGLSVRLSYFALAIFFIVFATLLMKWKDGGFNRWHSSRLRSLFSARSLVCMFRLYPCCITAHGLWQQQFPFCCTISWMKKLDPDFAKAKESLEIDMDRFEIV